jgi:hypothetical protein
MRRIAISAAALMAMGVMTTVAQAEVLNGTAPKQGNQCFKFTSPDHVRDSRFGTWAACPEPAAATVAPKRKRAASR